MSQRTTLQASDEGKRVVNEAGDEIGIVAEVDAGTAHVDPNPGIADTIMAKLGWQDADEETYQLPSSDVMEITDDLVRIRRDI